jgi:hypothetical protein
MIAARVQLNGTLDPSFLVERLVVSAVARQSKASTRRIIVVGPVGPQHSLVSAFDQKHNHVSQHAVLTAEQQLPLD